MSGWSERDAAFLAEMGLAGYCQDIERLDVARLELQTLRLISERPALEGRIREAGARFQDRLREQEDLLASLIVGDPGAAPGARPLAARDPVA